MNANGEGSELEPPEVAPITMAQLSTSYEMVKREGMAIPNDAHYAEHQNALKIAALAMQRAAALGRVNRHQAELDGMDESRRLLESSLAIEQANADRLRVLQLEERERWDIANGD